MQDALAVIGCQSDASQDHSLFPVSRFRSDELQSSYLELQDVISASSSSELGNHWETGTNISVPAEAPRFSDGSLSAPFFEHFLSLGIPVVVTGLRAKLQLPWTPNYFADVYGTKSCTIEETASGESHTARVCEFFSSYGDKSPSRKVLKLKVCASNHQGNLYDILIPGG